MADNQSKPSENTLLVNLWNMFMSRFSKYFSVFPVLAEICFVVFLIWVGRAIVYREQRIKHSALLVDGKYAVRADREHPREHNKKFFFQNALGLWIHHCNWIDLLGDRDPKGLVVMLHGHSEHINRHGHVAEYYASKGYAVFGIDHQGFGRSEGDRGHVESFQHYIDDVMLFFTRILKADYGQYEHLPKFLHAHSMGGLITAYAALRMQSSPEPWHKLSGVVLGNPALYVDNSVPLTLLRVLAYLAPKFHAFDFPSAPSTTFLQIKHHSQYDPLNFSEKLRPHHTYEMIMTVRELNDRADEFITPILIFHGDDDQTVNIEGSREFIKKIKSEDKYLLELPGLQHEPMQEPEAIRKPIKDYIVNWLDERASAYAKAQ
mmetsp:Transcript_17042/g.21788  ORF Transcript_17042/g.21788 Transcript_17042/m.21788 type:complete len:376 (+) Transcript_17042:166-1293(+)|eukprot:CAMPEP_0204878264 /NCGR_PEP_ID=MMETSP1348-20121228/48655_1 /ASSEMBLY_ACC=CAM_ASM_000700 /TAXON_ID=215587 /ORGANISM="Aplanochytrium stocchinoi, Strain GSBS06" /LENGTH=375 /DNA_ID=CAMNT_0052035231 /DNA_START=18 /DNA_END=1145 /DNA_ORIENTATION=-